MNIGYQVNVFKSTNQGYILIQSFLYPGWSGQATAEEIRFLRERFSGTEFSFEMVGMMRDNG